MDDINGINIMMQKSGALKELSKSAYEVFTYPNAKQAYELALQFESAKKDSKLLPEESGQCQSIVACLKSISMQLISLTEVYNLFRNNLAEILELDDNLIDRIKFLLISLPVEDRNTVKMKIAEAIEQNQQQVTHRPVSTNVEESLPSTIAEWVKYYYGFMQGRMTDRIREIEFFTKSQAVAIISVQEKEKIKKLFTVYRFLHYPSDTPEGFEENLLVRDESGGLKVFSDGNFEPIRYSASRVVKRVLNTVSGRSTIVSGGSRMLNIPPVPASTAVDPLDFLKHKYRSYRHQRQRILEAEDAITVKSRGDTEWIERTMALAARNGNKYEVIACLKALARQGALPASLKRNTAWMDAVTEYMQKKYSPRFKPVDIVYATSNQKIQAVSPVLVSEFLQYILQEKLRLSENDAALIGTEIGQIMGGAYQGMAYGNTATGNFEWAKNRIENRVFVSELGEHFV